MFKTKLLLQRGLTSLVLMVLIVVPTAPALADEADPSAPAADTTQPTDPPPAAPSTPPPAPDPAPLPEPTPTPAPATPPPAPSTPGPQQPNGASASTYHYNPETGLWENEYYTWDPVTRQTRPKKAQPYSYNPATGRWDSKEWVYNPASGKYQPNIVSVEQPPAGSILLPTSSSQPAGPNNQVNNSERNSGIFDLFYDARISNVLVSNARSGDATISFNTKGGSATTGTAQSMATILNLLQSASNLGSGGLATFISNIYGDVQGDLYIDPAALANAQLSGTSSQANNDIKINSSASAQINNDIDLSASSGNALVEGNTTAGNATSGNANAVANLVNIINSMAMANQSFMGLVNIYGNLDGDILLPPGFLESLLASNAPTTTIDTSQIQNSEILANFTDNQSINNNVTLGAVTGQANVTKNTTAGNATSGNAKTNLTLLNLTGKQVVGKDCLLVFVNVLGNWVGLIMNAPNGATAAALGGGLSQNSTLDNLNLEANMTNNSQINNNINVNASSGDATVSGNTKVGNATSGNATASVNLANIINSQISLSDWFGILFINVFGTWNGSFGIDTVAGNKPQTPTAGGMGGGGGNEVKVFKFVPSSSSGSSYKLTSVPIGAQDSSQTSDQSDKETVMAASTTPQNPASKAPATHRNFWLPILSSLVFFGFLTGVEKVRNGRQQRRVTPPSVIHPRTL